ncbi:SUN domain-containing protein 1-like protein [Dinothrombium tinctorium]|uniref:SUN domain-containing protein 1-like protein n=1 Tax=Dinothrombium tinctorium TaxID=1965070 RepID=A0A3S3R107_9ACAR|nr:SUN domain-containing protein 1-like protein [Dinothrombium tinctorium]
MEFALHLSQEVNVVEVFAVCSWPIYVFISLIDSFTEAGTMCEVHGQTKHRHNHYSHHTHKSSTTGTVIAYSGVGLEPPINDCVQLSSSNGESKSIRDIQPSIIVKRRSILHRRTFFENAAEISEKLPQIGKKLPFFILLLSLLPFICWYCGGFAKDILSNVSTSFSSPMQLKSATPVVPSIHLPQDHLTSNAIQELQSNQIKLIEQVSQLTEEVQKLRQKNHRNHDPHDDIDLRSKLEDTNFKIANCCLNETELASIISAKIMSLLVDTNASSSEANIIRSLLKNIVQYEVEKTAASSQIYTDEKLDSIYKIVSEKIESLKTETYSSLNDISSAFENRPTAIDNNLTVSNIKDLIREALTIYDADKTGEPDYALESAGGTVIDIRCSETFDPYGIHYKIFGIPVWSTSNSPRAVIQPTVTPGDCWAFRGSQGYLVVKLSRMIVPTSFTYEHIPKQISREGNINSAPREFQVRGLKDESDTQGEILGNYYYEDNGQPLQNFPVKHPNPKQYQFIEFVIISNHGHEEYTCLYRFRVHGKRIHF